MSGPLVKPGPRAVAAALVAAPAPLPVALQVLHGGGSCWHNVALFDAALPRHMDCAQYAVEMLHAVDSDACWRMVAQQPPHAVLWEYDPERGWVQT